MTEKILVHHLPRKINEVYPYLADMGRFVSIHPVIYKHENISGNNYKLYERLTVAGLGISFSYPVSIETAVLDKQVILFSEIRKGVKLRLVFDLVAEGDTTKIIETVSFKGPMLIAPVFMSFLERTHIRMMDNIAVAN